MLKCNYHDYFNVMNYLNDCSYNLSLLDSYRRARYKEVVHLSLRQLLQSLDCVYTSYPDSLDRGLKALLVYPHGEIK